MKFICNPWVISFVAIGILVLFYLVLKFYYISKEPVTILEKLRAQGIYPRIRNPPPNLSDFNENDNDINDND